MPKGDSQNSQNAIDTQGGIAQNNLNNLWGQNTDRTTNFQNLYQTGVGNNLNDYQSIMNNYRNFLNPGSASQGGGSGQQTNGNTQQPANPNFTPNQLTGDPNKDAILNLYNKYGVTPGGAGSGFKDLDYWSKDAMEHASGDQNYVLGRLESDLKGTGPDAGSGSGGAGGGGGDLAGNNYANSILGALQGYQGFSQNGGFSPQDIQDLRARAIAPTRSIFSSAKANIDRQKALNNGYSPNYTAASAKLARDEANTIGDQQTNANAAIAQMVQQGKLYGLSGMGSLGSTSRGQNSQAMSGLTSLYGANPGLTQTFGNQVLQSAGQGINLGQLQNQLGLGIMNAQNQHANIPGNFQSAMGNINSALGLGSQLGGALGQGGFLNNIFGGGGTPNLGAGISGTPLQGTNGAPNLGYQPGSQAFTGWSS